jgi:aminoglycoside phosphotransferase (APT) family kinase protein
MASMAPAGAQHGAARLGTSGDRARPGPSRGRHQSSREAISNQLSGLPQLVAAGVIDSALGKAAQSLVEVEELLGYEGPGVLLHNDLKPDHLLGRHDGHHLRLSAIIDWGDAAVGDPAADLARLSMARPVVTDAFLEGYGVPMSDELQNRLARYRLLWNIRALSYEYRASGDWFDVYRARIMSDITQLSR